MEQVSPRLSLGYLGKVQFDDRIRSGTRFVQLRASGTVSPGPGIAEPNCGQDSKISGLRATICDRDLDQNVFDIGLGIFHQHVEVAMFVEYTRIEQFEFRLILVAASILFY